MYKYLFVGSYKGNGGPPNVNKGIIANLDKDFKYVKSENKMFKRLELVFKYIFCDVVIFSGLYSKLGVVLCKLGKHINKKSIYIAHGCYKIESKLNGFEIEDKPLKTEHDMLYNVDLILAVSKIHKDNLINAYPFCEDHISYLYNGVVKPNYDISGIERKKGKIIVVGGDRKLKNNVKVAEAMKIANCKGILEIYGYLYEPNKLPTGNNIKFCGRVPQEQLYKELASSELYILNSLYEPFALSVFDALLCGCSILISEKAGALELLDYTENDVIHNPNDVNEIAKKISYLLEHPNNERLMKNVNLEEISYKKEVEKLKEKCESLLKNNI